MKLKNTPELKNPGSITKYNMKDWIFVSSKNVNINIILSNKAKMKIYLNTHDRRVSFPTIELFVPSEDRDFCDGFINNWFCQDGDPVGLSFVKT